MPCATTSWYWWWWLMVLVAFSSASIGDRSTSYIDCTSNCTVRDCPSTASWQLHRYLCIRDCQYECMWPTVDEFRRQFNTVPQFYGKWPFIRLLSMQEPASTLFSVANLFTFRILLQRVNRLPFDAPFRTVWQLYALVGISTWMCSTLFHWHDTLLTERLDYFSAFAAIIYGLFACILRVCWKPTTNRSMMLFASPLIVFYIYHVGYLSMIDFDYAYNMQANVVCGLATSVLWIGWCIGEWWRDGDDNGRLFYCLLTVVCGSCFLVFELFDFAPIGWIIDAHALWHFSTIPLALFWSRFIVADCLQMRQAAMIRHHQA